ncbi:MAG: transposase [Bacteroidota bacterium]
MTIQRELLLLETNPTESGKVWGEYLDKLRKRGIDQVDLIVSDSILHFSEEASKSYPSANIQKCVVR